jgi:hypothetical protein
MGIQGDDASVVRPALHGRRLVFSWTMEGMFFALDAESGKPLWQFQTGGAIWAPDRMLETTNWGGRRGFRRDGCGAATARRGPAAR